METSFVIFKTTLEKTVLLFLIVLLNKKAGEMSLQCSWHEVFNTELNNQLHSRFYIVHILSQIVFCFKDLFLVSIIRYIFFLWLMVFVFTLNDLWDLNLFLLQVT